MTKALGRKEIYSIPFFSNNLPLTHFFPRTHIKRHEKNPQRSTSFISKYLSPFFYKLSLKHLLLIRKMSTILHKVDFSFKCIRCRRVDSSLLYPLILPPYISYLYYKENSPIINSKSTLFAHMIAFCQFISSVHFIFLLF